ncbi:chemotaxis protein CheA [Candidatus Woesearchaeota archaeon]|nr:chemotaxis protein CheA [Candidatus Woesearchaeota archaeon]
MNTVKFLKEFLAESREHIEKLNRALIALEKNPGDQESINQLFRSAHTLKGSSAMMGFTELADRAHQMEDLLVKLRNKEVKLTKEVVDTLFASIDALGNAVEELMNKGAQNGHVLDSREKQDRKTKQAGIHLAERPELARTPSSIRIESSRLDALLELVGEFLVNKLKLSRLKQDCEALNQPLTELDRLMQELQFQVMGMRMIPLEHICMQFPRMVRDLAARENKAVNFSMSGLDSELDRTILDKLGEPLVHLLRNAVDHGIEANEERGGLKKKAGRITLSAVRDRNKVLISVEDDGAGLDIEEIKRVAVEKGIITKEQLGKLPDEKVYQLPFNQRYSTSKKVTEISGRGVGLDAVKRTVESLSGKVVLDTKKGEGTKITIELPLTLAIVQCFLVAVGQASYAIPMTNIVKIVETEENDIKTMEKQEIIIFEDQEIALFHLARLFEQPSETRKRSVAIVVDVRGERVGFLVDRIVGRQDVLIKPLDPSLRDINGLSGATILGDGSTALIIDMQTLLESCSSK